MYVCVRACKCLPCGEMMASPLKEHVGFFSLEADMWGAGRGGGREASANAESVRAAVIWIILIYTITK